MVKIKEFTVERDVDVRVGLDVIKLVSGVVGEEVEGGLGGRDGCIEDELRT
jgi:hypothetical protein